MKQVVFWSPNYAPELIGIPPLVTDAAEWLKERGFGVTVVTAMPNYPERRIQDGYRGRLWCHEQLSAVDVYRSWLRVHPEERFRDKALYELSFALFSLPNAIRCFSRCDALVCVVPSLAAASCGAALVRAARRAGFQRRLVLWVQDLVLSAALALDGVGATAQRLLSSARRIELATARAADSVVVCSPGFRRYLIGGGVDSERIVTIYNWVDINQIRPRAIPEGGTRTRFLYAGNLGYTQGFETLIEAGVLAGPEVQVDIVGDGNAAEHVRRLVARASNVAVRPPVPRPKFPDLLAAAHAYVIVQRQVSAGANLPSKIGPYLASGRPIVASVDLATPAADLLRASGGAILVPPEDALALSGAMRQLHEDPKLRAELGAKARAFAVTWLSRDKSLSELEQVIRGVSPGAGFDGPKIDMSV